MKFLRCNCFYNHNWHHPWVVKDKNLRYIATEKNNKAFVVICLDTTEYPALNVFPMLTLNLSNFRSEVIKYPNKRPDYEVLKI